MLCQTTLGMIGVDIGVSLGIDIGIGVGTGWVFD